MSIPRHRAADPWPTPLRAGCVSLLLRRYPEMKHLLLSALVLLTPCLSSAAEAPSASPMTGAVAREVRAADGERIPVLVLEPHRPSKGPAPVAVLVHGLTRNKEDWLV